MQDAGVELHQVNLHLMFLLFALLDLLVQATILGLLSSYILLNILIEVFNV